MEQIKNVLVTGSLGYIGSILSPLLVKEGYGVLGLDAGLFREYAFVPREMDGITQIIKDIRDVEARDLKDIDAVLHLAALSDDPQEQLGQELMEEINVKASIRLAKLAKQAGVKRFLFSSSCSVYGAADGNTSVDEMSSLNPVSTYARSKVRVEEALSKLADETFCPVYLRNATCYGISPRMRFDLVANNLIGYAHTTGEIKILSDGTPWRPIVHIEDVSRAFLAFLKTPRETVFNQTFNIGRNDENYQIKNIADLIFHAMPNTKIALLNQTGPDKRSYKVNFDKIAAIKQFRPKWTLAAYIPVLYNLLKTKHFTLDNFSSEQYHTLKFYQRLQKQNVIDTRLRKIL